MKELIDLLKLLGVHVNISESSSPILLFACSILVLSIIALFCFINILLYFTILHITDNKLLLDKLSRYIILVKIINLYRQTRIAYLLFEVILFLVSLGSVIWLCSRVVYGLM